MSWDLVIFSSKQTIITIEDVDEDLFIPIDFNEKLTAYFDNIIATDDHREIKGAHFSIDYDVPEAPVSHMIFSIYGEHALYELVSISKLCAWQIFDTGSGEMINLDHPEKNGYADFHAYLNHVKKMPPELDGK